MTLENGLKSRVFGDYLCARGRIDFFIYNTQENAEVIKPNYKNAELSPKKGLDLNDETGALFYYQNLRNSLEELLIKGFTKEDIKRYNPPEYITGLIKY